MSELKAISSGEIYNIIEYEDCYRTDDLYYPKSEADKVIAEKDKVITYARALVREDIKLILHQKYKRSLDNAWWCRKLSNVYALIAYTHRGWKIARYYDEKAELYRKWRKRWLKLAEKFKELNNEKNIGVK